MRRTVAGLAVALAVSLSGAASAGAADYEAFVGCDEFADEPTPAQACQIGDPVGAFFEADEETRFDVCVEYPSDDLLCAEDQFAEANVLYVNAISTGLAGTHQVIWFVEDVEVGFWEFEMTGQPLPTPVTPPAPPVPITAPPPTAQPVGVSPACARAKRRAAGLRTRLRLAETAKHKARLRATLKQTKARIRLVC